MLALIHNNGQVPLLLRSCPDGAAEMFGESRSHYDCDCFTTAHSICQTDMRSNRHHNRLMVSVTEL